jgi:myo-inositol-1-phosphate synthase
MAKIKVAIVGIGNCASSLIQGLEFYKWVDEKSGFIPGITHNLIGDYKISDIEIVAAFDIDRKKVGKDISEAIFTYPNCAERFCEVPQKNVVVKRGPVLDGLGNNLKKIISVNPDDPVVNISTVLKDCRTEILINFLPTGSTKATEYYANQALKSKCGFINAIPEPIATNRKWSEKFKKANLPLAGDDIKSQLGATILHRSIIDLCMKWGCKINNTSQLNTGYNMDFFNLTEPGRGISKIVCKTDAIKKIIPYPTPVSIEIITAEQSQNSKCLDKKQTLIQLVGENFGSRPLTINVELNVEDSPNAAGVMVDVIRSMKIAIDRNDSGVITPICGKFFKRSLENFDEETANEKFKKFLGG